VYVPADSVPEGIVKSVTGRIGSSVEVVTETTLPAAFVTEIVADPGSAALPCSSYRSGSRALPSGIRASGGQERKIDPGENYGHAVNAGRRRG
jgi:hypothetical protein